MNGVLLWVSDLNIGSSLLAKHIAQSRLIQAITGIYDYLIYGTTLAGETPHLQYKWCYDRFLSLVGAQLNFIASFYTSELENKKKYRSFSQVKDNYFPRAVLFKYTCSSAKYYFHTNFSRYMSFGLILYHNRFWLWINICWYCILLILQQTVGPIKKILIVWLK